MIFRGSNNICKFAKMVGRHCQNLSSYLHPLVERRHSGIPYKIGNTGISPEKNSGKLRNSLVVKPIFINEDDSVIHAIELDSSLKTLRVTLPPGPACIL